MKENVGELNATVVVMLAIGVLMAFFYYTLWPLIKQNFHATSQCDKAMCEVCPTNDCEYVECHERNNENNTFQCIYKG